jgi:diguanylate cyclase (GGDEF)-like protein
MIEMNRQLSVLSLTYGLTGVYNRMGCERVAYPFLERRHILGKSAILMFADINKMKVINDKYGHLQGDLAICTVAKVIREVLKDDWIVVRYGGDEFLMVGECESDRGPESLLKEIDETLEKTREQMQLPYPLKAGLGYVVISPDEKLNLSDCLKRADEAMYEMKKKQHNEMKKV